MRLTKYDKELKNYFYNGSIDYDETEMDLELCNKLGQLEDIEDELGIDLITLFKALRDSIAIKNEDGTIIVMWACPRFQIGLDYETAWILYGPLTEQKVLNIKDYGKTWALTKEELDEEWDPGWCDVPFAD